LNYSGFTVALLKIVYLLYLPCSKLSRNYRLLLRILSAVQYHQKQKWSRVPSPFSFRTDYLSHP